VVSQSQYTRKASDIKPTVWVYRADDGTFQTREQTKDERDSLQIPPKGEYRLRVKAFAEPFEMNKKAEYGGGVQEMTRLLLEVVGGPGAGKRTTLLCSFSFGKSSNLGRVFAAATNRVIASGDDCDPVDMLEGEFVAYLQPSKNLDEHGKPKGTDCSWDTVAPAAGTASAEDASTWA
jgi:hypothetical protein